ncbi:MAG: SGNH/GDSL hydrolase family protein [Anaerostipes sp.]|uniref:SGNH/GDSL hydrolase family protein n=1 Tax=Anaerostipes sp. TaxID=1872530 RepID=UPI0039944C6C
MKTILCYGDSNTYGYNPETGFRYPYEQRWTSILQKNLGDSAIVIPEGLNGRTTCFEDQIRPGRNGAVYLDPCLHTHGPIDLVVLMLGTNDMKIRFQATPTDIGKGIDRLIKMILSITPQKREDGTSSKILLMSPPYLGENLCDIPSGEEMGYQRGIEYSRRLAPIYEEWARFHQINFLDAAKYAKASELDACHLTVQSHKTLGEMVTKKCREILDI